MKIDKQYNSQSIKPIQGILYSILGDRKLRADMLYPLAVPSSLMPVTILVAGGEGTENNQKNGSVAYLAKKVFCTTSIIHRSREQVCLTAQATLEQTRQIVAQLAR